MSELRLPPPPAHVHFIGIGGIGMSGLARILHTWGYRVSGSDASVGAQTAALQSLGVEIVIGHDDPALAGTCEVLVTTLRAESGGAIEIAAAKANGAKIVKRGQLLGMIANERTSIAVAGTHGKSTTSGMLAVALRELGQDPSYAIGAMLGETGTNAAPGSGPHMVVEADEFDRAFLFLRPTVAIITSVSFDHPDVFIDQNDYDRAFVDFARGVRSGGRLVLPADDAGSRRVKETLRTLLDLNNVEVVTFGSTPGADWSISRSGAGWIATDPSGEPHAIKPTVSGDHNIRNTVAAVIVLQSLGFPIEDAIAAACAFSGVQRRFEHKGSAAGIDVVDDYAHHPEEIAVMISTTRDVYPGRRLIVVHQPHTYSRTKILLNEFAAALDEADVPVVMDIYPSGEMDTLEVSADDLAARMKRHAIRTRDPEDTALALGKVLQSGDVVLTLGAGTVTAVGSLILKSVIEDSSRKLISSDCETSSLKIQESAKLSLYTTMRIGGPADFLVRATTPEELVEASRWARHRGLPVTVIGGGSNLLVSDAGIRGLTIIVKTSGEKSLRMLDIVDEGDSVLLTVPAQAPISGIGRYCAEHGWTGMDWAVGLPGQIGGATVNNAGAHGTELKDHLVSIELLTDRGEIVSESVDWLDPSYRMTSIKGSFRPRPWIVLSSTFRLQKGDSVALVRFADEHADFRKRTQPTGACSGSTFANPEGDYAGRLLEAAGLKGYTIGAMQFSPKHANWVVNTGGGTAADAWALIEHGGRVVEERFGVSLRPEVERVGEGIETYGLPHEYHGEGQENQ